MPPQIVFLGQRASPLCGRLVLIGRKTDVVRHVQSLFAQDGVALTLAQSAVSAAQVSAHSGAKAHATLPPGPVVGEHVLDFHAVMLPAEATRYNSALRADVITRHFGGVATSPSLSIGSDNDDDGGTEAKRDCKVHVEVLVPGGVAVGAAVLSSAAAMVRSLPEYTRKGDKHATSSKTQIAACFLSAHDGGFDLVEDELLLQHAAVVAREVRACARLVDMPCNELNCTTFAQHVQERVASLSSVEYKEIVGTELQDQGFGGIYGVGKAAEHPPRLVILSHTPADASETYVLAGKVAV